MRSCWYSTSWKTLFLDGYICCAFALYLLAYQWSKILFDALGIAVLITLVVKLVLSYQQKTLFLSSSILFTKPYSLWVFFIVSSAIGFFSIWGHFSWQWPGWGKTYFLPLLNALLFTIYWMMNPVSGKKSLYLIFLLLPTLSSFGAAYEFLVVLDEQERVSNQFSHPVLFGGMGVVALSLVGVLTFSEKSIIKYLSFSAIFIGIIGILLSGARSGYLTLLLLLVFIVGLHAFRSHFRKGVVILLLFVSMLSVLGYSFRPVISDRLQQTLSELQVLRDTKGYSVDSIGSRLAFWMMAPELINESPLVGLSVTGMYLYIQERNASANFQRYTPFVKHPHADVLLAWYSGGVLGVVFLLYLYVFPYWFARRFCEQHIQHCVGVFLGSFIIVGLADSYFLQAVTLKFYFCFLTLLIILGLSNKWHNAEYE